MKRRTYVLVFLLEAFSLGLLLPIMSLIFTGKGGSVKELSIGISILSATVILLELPSGLFADLFGRRDTYCWSVVFHITSLLLCLSGSFPVLYAGMAFKGIGKALGSGSLEALFTDRYIEVYGKERLHHDFCRKFLRLESDRARYIRQNPLFFITHAVVYWAERDGIAGSGDRVCRRLYFRLPVCRIGRTR